MKTPGVSYGIQYCTELYLTRKGTMNVVLSQVPGLYIFYSSAHYGTTIQVSLLGRDIINLHNLGL